ncbi:hypothetical protein HK098_003726 [Nowakowskiella sp. JEL0407]|nr:hypothetical protein HK098_003726 [Nowakowskiella sp. JEL0407]
MNLQNLPSETISDIQLYLDPLSSWELCKTSKYLYTLGPLPHQIDSILTGKVLDDDEQLKIYSQFLNYCLDRENRCSHRLKSIASLLKIREWARNQNSFYVGGNVPLIHESEKVFYVRNPDSRTDAVVIDFSKEIGELERTVLLESGKPAAFGMGQKTIVDFDVRKAIALSCTEFVYDLHRVLPIIMKQVTDVLGTGKEARAELYKMNVYEEGGFFKSHVDTPKSDQMFGSLVIGLPILHEGGELVVRHHGQSQTFSFKPQDRCELTWAAFYSDCEHEILPVKSGLRITLTFNLYWSESKIPLDLDITKYPIYHMLKQIKENSFFVNSGYNLAFGLQYAYPFESGTQVKKYLSIKELKGCDVLIHLAALHLGLRVELKPAYVVNFEQEDFELTKLENDLNFGNSYEDGANIALVVREKFDGLKTEYSWDTQSALEDIASSIDSEIDKKLLWITFAANEFIADYSVGTFGNEAAVENHYIRVALIVSLS